MVIVIYYTLLRMLQEESRLEYFIRLHRIVIFLHGGKPKAHRWQLSQQRDWVYLIEHVDSIIYTSTISRVDRVLHGQLIQYCIHSVRLIIYFFVPIMAKVLLIRVL